MSEDVLQQARHGMSVLWDEVQTLRAKLQDAPGQLEARFAEFRDGLHSIHLKLESVMSAHDEIAAILKDVSADADALIAAKIDGDAANADLLTAAKALQTKMAAAVKELTEVSLSAAQPNPLS